MKSSVEVDIINLNKRIDDVYSFLAEVLEVLGRRVSELEHKVKTSEGKKGD